MLDDYLNVYPSSLIGLNLKACLRFQQFGGKQAEAELKPLNRLPMQTPLFGVDLIKHNKVMILNLFSNPVSLLKMINCSFEKQEVSPRLDIMCGSVFEERMCESTLV